MIWSRASDVRLLLAVVVLAGFGWFIAVWGWSEHQWQTVTKPRLLALLADTGGPKLERLSLKDASGYKFSAVCDGVHNESSDPLTVDGSRVRAESFEISFSENFPNLPPRTYFLSLIGPMSVTAIDVEAAKTQRERKAAIDAVQARAIQFGDQIVDEQQVDSIFDRAVLADGPDAIVLYQSSSKLITGVVKDRAETQRRNFLLKVKGIDRGRVEMMIQHLRFTDE